MKHKFEVEIHTAGDRDRAREFVNNALFEVIDRMADGGSIVVDVNDPPEYIVPDTADEMLRLIDDFLVEADDDEGRMFIAVIAALRGPDKTNAEYLKFNTTSRIRAIAFPRASRQAVEEGYGAVSERWVTNLDGKPIPWTLDGMNKLMEVEATDYHFYRHVAKAVEAFADMGRTNDKGVPVESEKA